MFPPERCSWARRLLTTAEMAKVDAAAERLGPGVIALMDQAGKAVADAVPFHAPVAILCGPGNNGGDGYAAARYLLRDGLPVTLHADTPPKPGSAAAHHAAGLAVRPMADFHPKAGMIVIDALFGAGLKRAVEGAAAAALVRAAGSGAFVIAVDVPSGLDGDTGHPTGPVLPANRTVTFFRTKPGHWLQPGRALCGDVLLADIGLSEHHCAEIGPEQLSLNGPGLWREDVPASLVNGHKFGKGHVLVVSGPALRTGAARLSATAALHAGAGLVTLCGDAAAMAEQAHHVTAIMLRAICQPEDLAGLMRDARIRACVVGPAAGTGAETLARLDQVLAAGVPAVIDADAITALGGQPEWLAARNRAGAVLTPHAGEFERLFGPETGAGQSKVERARAAARRSGSVVVFKGADTVIAAPDGRAAINANAGPELATAGSGDVLAGIIAANLARGMPPFPAAAAGVHAHAEAGKRLGPGLVADRLAEAIRPV